MPTQKSLANLRPGSNGCKSNAPSTGGAYSLCELRGHTEQTPFQSPPRRVRRLFRSQQIPGRCQIKLRCTVYCAMRLALRFLMTLVCHKRNLRNSAFRSERLRIASESCCCSTSLVSLTSTTATAAAKRLSRRTIWALTTRNLGSTYRLSASGT